MIFFEDFVCVLQIIFFQNLKKNLDVGTGDQKHRQEVYEG